MKRFLAAFLAVIMSAGGFGAEAFAETRDLRHYKDALEIYPIDDNVPTYRRYLQSHPANYPAGVIEVDIGGAELRTEEDGVWAFTFTVEESGF